MVNRTELCAENYGSYSEFFNAVRNLSKEYGNLPASSVIAAYDRAVTETSPYVQNNRVKHISSFPVDYTKDEIAKMVVNPNGNEMRLRQVSHALEWSAYPYYKIRKTYQSINTYRYYSYPVMADKIPDGKDSPLIREWKLVEKFSKKLRPDAIAHKLVGQCMQEGKVCYTPRYSIDKAHNKVNYAMMQQIPSDYWKITGFNSTSGYSVMFDMMWLMQPGTDWRQFGDLLLPYLGDFQNVFDEEPGTIAYASDRNCVKAPNGKTLHINMDRMPGFGAAGDPKLYTANGRWCYWVTLPADKAWVFEADDCSTTVSTPLSGLFLAFDQISALEEVQLQVSQNTLTGVVLGEIPYHNTTGQGTADEYKLSASGRRLFLQYWYDMAAQGSVWGTGAYFAPVENLHMETFSADPNSTNYSTAGYAYAVEKAGLAALIPVNDNPRAGLANLSAMLEEKYCQTIYNQFERMMESLYAGMHLKYEWGFKMFGGFSTDEKRMEQAKAAMTLGYLPAALEFNALNGRSIMDDICISEIMDKIGVMDRRIPLQSSYNSSVDNNTDGENRIGRPSVGVEEIGTEDTAEGSEDDLDNE